MVYTIRVLAYECCIPSELLLMNSVFIQSCSILILYFFRVEVEVLYTFMIFSCTVIIYTHVIFSLNSYSQAVNSCSNSHFKCSNNRDRTWKREL